MKSEILSRTSKAKRHFKMVTKRLTLDLSKRTLCEICQRPKDKKDEVRLQNENLNK